jgi:hypothetical protein
MEGRRFDKLVYTVVIPLRGIYQKAFALLQPLLGKRSMKSCYRPRWPEAANLKATITDKSAGFRSSNYSKAYSAYLLR